METRAAQNGQSAVSSTVVGARLKNMRDEIIRLGTDLMDLVDRPLASQIEQALDKARVQKCQIAILGQMKAGKSSVVNALMGRPGFLPTDVNPWTTAVTLLHFGQAIPANGQARFAFWAEDEWHQFAQSAGPFSQLLQRFLPGQGDDLREQNLEAMHRRTELRLGRYYKHLFGKTHWYNAATTEIIGRYVCLGQDVDKPTSELLPGRYADITKTADLYLESASFAIPATLIDTPGTNDPLLVRDEITLRNIVDADVCVVVVTAQRPMTTADLALLRLLHGVRKDRIVVFINRIDEIPSIAAKAAEIEARVKETIKREFPLAPIPVVAGSAVWASLAHDGTRIGLPDIRWPEIDGYARSIGALKGESAVLSGASEPATEDVTAILASCSGMPALADQISALLMRGVNGYLLSELGATLLAVAVSVASAGRNEVNSLDSDPRKITEARNVTADLARRRASLQSLRDVAGRIQDYKAASQEFVHAKTVAIVSALQETLESRMSAFADEQAHAVREAYLDGQRLRTWRCDAVRLRNQMEADVLAAFEEATRVLALIQDKTASELSRALLEAAPNLDIPIKTASPHNFDLSPSLGALGKAVVFDVEDRWWGIWWRRGGSVDEYVRKIRELVLGEFTPIVAELCQSVGADLEKYASMFNELFFIRCLDAIQAVINHLDKAELRPVGSNSGDVAAASSLPLRSHAAALRRRLVAGEALIGELRSWTERYRPGTSDSHGARL